MSSHTPHNILKHLIEESRKGKTFKEVVNEYIEKMKVDSAEQENVRETFKEEATRYPNFDFVQKMLTYQYIRDAETSKYYLIEPRSKIIENIKEDAIKSAFKPAAFEWLNACKLYTARLGYNPNSSDFLYEEGLIKSVNLYRPAEWQVPYFFDGKKVPNSELPTDYENFFRHLVGSSQLSYDYTISFLAACVQKNKKAFTYYTMLGSQGIGKGVLFEIVRALVGKNNATLVEATKLAEMKFNDKLRNKKVIFFDELTIRNAEDDSVMKQFVNPEIDIEAKGVDKKSYTNYACVMVASNELGNLKIEQGDRRYSFVDTTKNTLLKFVAEQYPELTLRQYVEERLLNPDNIKRLGEYLLNYEINKTYIEQIIDSEARKNQKFNRLQDWEVDVFRQLAPKFAGKELEAAEATAEIRTICNNNKINPGRERWKKLSELSPGFFKFIKKSRADKTRYYALVFAKIEDQPQYIASENED
jgi:Family of unknown function (DUF5906)